MNYAGAGTQTAALAFGGATPPATAATEEYNGTSWTSVNSMNTARSELRRCWYTNSCFSIWWFWYSYYRCNRGI
jgi:hypothetical protein